MRTILSMMLLISLSSITPAANASFIVNGNTGIESISLNQSFESFYDRGGSADFSSNTGFEKNDSIVLMIAEYLGDYALIGLVDSNISYGDETEGRVDLSLSDFSPLIGSLLFVDDPIEDVTFNSTGFNASFRWTDDYNDGFIYQLGDEMAVTIDIFLDNFTGITSTRFIDFSNNSVSVLDLGSPSSTNEILIRNDLSLNNNVVEASAPASLLLLALSLFGICLLRRR